MYVNIILVVCSTIARLYTSVLVPASRAAPEVRILLQFYTALVEPPATPFNSVGSEGIYIHMYI